MGSDFSVNEAEVAGSAMLLTNAVDVWFVKNSVPHPAAAVPSATGAVGTYATELVQGCVIARSALADGVREVAQMCRAVLSETTELDRALAASISSGYLVDGGGR